MPGSAREIPGTLMKGKYQASNEFNTSYDMNDAVGSFEATTEIPSWTMGDEDGEPETSTTAEEYFSNSSGISVVEEVLNDVVDRVMEICEYAEETKHASTASSCFYSLFEVMSGLFVVLVFVIVLG